MCEQPQKRLRRIPLAQRAHVQIPLALGKPPSVRRDEQRHMIICRLRKAELPLEPDLPRRGGKKVAASDHLRHAGLRIVGHNRQLIGIHTVGPAEDKIPAAVR